MLQQTDYYSQFILGKKCLCVVHITKSLSLTVSKYYFEVANFYRTRKQLFLPHGVYMNSTVQKSRSGTEFYLKICMLQSKKRNTPIIGKINLLHCQARVHDLPKKFQRHLSLHLHLKTFVLLYLPSVPSRYRTNTTKK